MMQSSFFIKVCSLVGISLLLLKSGFMNDKAHMNRFFPEKKVEMVADIITLLPQSPDDIQQRVDRSLRAAQEALDTILAVDDSARTFANTAQALDKLEGHSELSLTNVVCQFVKLVYPDAQMRNAAEKAIVALSSFGIDHISSNVALYKGFKAYVEGNAHKESLTDEQWYYLNDRLKGFMRDGLGLPEDKQKRLQEISKQIVQLSLDFDSAVAKDRSFIEVEHKDLAGLDDDFIKQLATTQQGLYKVGVDYPTYFNVMDNCSVTETRKKLFYAFTNRAHPENEKTLGVIIALRDEYAKLLDFPSYAHFDLDNQMVKTPEKAEQFLYALVDKAYKKDEQEFKQLLRDLPESVVLSDDGKLFPWDVRYAVNYYKKKHFSLDPKKVAEYFPMQKTIDGLLAIYQQFFDLTFKEKAVTGLWHDDIRLIAVYDTDKLLGYLLLDLYPRENKYSHACQIDLIPAYDSATVVAAVIANFPKPNGDKPSLLDHEKEVITFFHEFGHAIHSLLGRTQIASLAGTSVKTDFVEMPSQMLEEWMWDKDMLVKISSHYQTGEPLPDSMIDTMLELKNFETGSFVIGQSLYALLSLELYKEGAHKNIQALYERLYKQLRHYTVFTPDSHMYSAFGHLTSYAAKYYGYLWSKVFALDLFATIKEQGLLNPAMGHKYAQTILGKGGTQDPSEMLRAFLGREPSQDAFFDDLGL